MTTINRPTGLDEDEIRQALVDDLARMRTQLGGDDFDSQRAVGTANTTILEQTEHVVARLDNGLYGICETCDNRIGTKRLAAFPSATMCMECAGKAAWAASRKRA